MNESGEADVLILGGGVIGQGLGYAAVPLVGAALAAGGLALGWLGNAGRRTASGSAASSI